MIEHVEYSAGFRIKGKSPKCYGVVNRAGKQHIRNYRRELKNGKGLSFLDLLEHHAELEDF